MRYSAVCVRRCGSCFLQDLLLTLEYRQYCVGILGFAVSAAGARVFIIETTVYLLCLRFSTFYRMIPNNILKVCKSTRALEATATPTRFFINLGRVSDRVFRTEYFTLTFRPNIRNHVDWPNCDNPGFLLVAVLPTSHPSWCYSLTR